LRDSRYFDNFEKDKKIGEKEEQREKHGKEKPVFIDFFSVDSADGKDNGKENWTGIFCITSKKGENASKDIVASEIGLQAVKEKV